MSFGPSITSQFEPSLLCVVVRGGLVQLVFSVREVAGTNPALLHDAFFLLYGPGINRRFEPWVLCVVVLVVWYSSCLPYERLRVRTQLCYMMLLFFKASDRTALNDHKDTCFNYDCMPYMTWPGYACHIRHLPPTMEYALFKNYSMYTFPIRTLHPTTEYAL